MGKNSGVMRLWFHVSGLFLEPEYSAIPNNGGVFKTGQFYQLGVQALTAGVIIAWTFVTSGIVLLVIKHSSRNIISSCPHSLENVPVPYCYPSPSVPKMSHWQFLPGRYAGPRSLCVMLPRENVPGQ